MMDLAHMHIDSELVDYRSTICTRTNVLIELVTVLGFLIKLRSEKLLHSLQKCMMNQKFGFFKKRAI